MLNSIATMYNQMLKTIVAIAGSATTVVVVIHLMPVGDNGILIYFYEFATRMSP